MTEKICAMPGCGKKVKKTKNNACSYACKVKYNQYLKDAGLISTDRNSVWSVSAEIEYVKYLGAGKWSNGSDLKHTRQWWLKKYLETAKLREQTEVVKAGIKYAKKLLAIQ